MLWPEGQNWGNTESHWTKLGSLLRHARAGIRESSHSGKEPKVFLHNQHGGDKDATKWFFDNLKQWTEFDDYDAIGLSYYPWRHGRLSDLEANLKQLASYGKELSVLETAYPWDLVSYDSHGNTNEVTKWDQLHPGYEASWDGQAKFVRDIRKMVANLPRGLGVVYWSPDWVATPSFASTWENNALFDNQSRLLPGLEEIGKSNQ